MEISNLAERNGPFIETALRAIFQMEDIQRIAEVNIDNARGYLEQNKGLYMFFVHAGFRYYPIYVGYTGNNFYARLQNHQVWGRNLQINGEIAHGRYVTVFPCDAGAKSLESLFLKAFDFALNTEENVAVREILDLSQGVNHGARSKLLFQHAWVDVQQGFLGMIQKIQNIEQAVQFPN